MAKRKRTERPNTSQKTGLSNMNPPPGIHSGKAGRPAPLVAPIVLLLLKLGRQVIKE